MLLGPPCLLEEGQEPAPRNHRRSGKRRRLRRSVRSRPLARHRHDRASTQLGKVLEKLSSDGKRKTIALLTSALLPPMTFDGMARDMAAHFKDTLDCSRPPPSSRNGPGSPQSPLLRCWRSGRRPRKLRRAPDWCRSHPVMLEAPRRAEIMATCEGSTQK